MICLRDMRPTAQGISCRTIKKFVKQGSEFVRVEPPKTFDELLTGLQILYHHVPSITGFPVYLGELDTMIEPFIEGMADDVVKEN